MFLYGESREQMFHVASMMPFTPPPDAKPDHLRDLMNEVRSGVMQVQKPWNLKLKSPDFIYNPLQAWVEADQVDLEYHLRRSALPSPGDERELGILVSRLHGYHVDFHRPPWEVHLIEGLEGGRFALYVKVHHSLVDGFSAMRILANALSKDPTDRDRPLFFAIPAPSRPPKHEEQAVSQYAAVMAAVREQYGAAKVATRALKRVFDSARSGMHEFVTPRQAPRSILNSRISQSRRFATQRLELERIKAIARAGGGTLNDVVLALSAGSLRSYLLEQNALPDQPLIAMCPVAVRAKDDVGGGNSVGAILASLATHIEHPAERFHEIVASTRHAKEQLAGMSKAAIIQYSALLIAPSLLQMVPATAGHMKPTFNVVISNVPGPEEALYFRGARLEASYPMSIPVHGQALNITCMTYAGMMCFGFTGCRDTLPHLQRLAVYCGDALVDLEKALL
jgi:WS/DGAT/MGAT family acyltransferase